MLPLDMRPKTSHGPASPLSVVAFAGRMPVQNVSSLHGACRVLSAAWVAVLPFFIVFLASLHLRTAYPLIIVH
jgi:hypothetical protein